MEVDIVLGSITIRLGGVATHCTTVCGAMVQPDNPSGVTLVSLTYATAGTGWQALNPVPIATDTGGSASITSTVALGTVIPELHSLVVGRTQSPRPPGYNPANGSENDEIVAVVVVPYAVDQSEAAVRIRPPAIGHPSTPAIAAMRATEYMFNTTTANSIPSVVDIDALPTTWGAFGNDRPNIDTYLARWDAFCGELWKGWATASYTPFLQHPGYGASMSALTSESLLLVVSKDDAAKRKTLAYRMTQWGMDLYGAFASGRSDGCDGGHMQGRKALVVLAGHMLEQSWVDASAVFPGQFNEDAQFYTAAPAWPWGWPYGYRGHTGFAWNLDQPIALWNSAVLYYLPRYFGQEVCGTQLGCAVAMRILDRTAEMGTGHFGMLGQWMQAPALSDQSAMASRDPALGGILWGTSYSIGGGPQDFGRAAWAAYSTYTAAAAPRIAVSGKGINIAPGDESPSSVDGSDFGVAQELASGTSRTFLVENTGDADLEIASVSVPTGYTVSTPLPDLIVPKSSASLVVRQDTDTPGTFAGTITIESNDPDNGSFEFAATGIVTALPVEGGGEAPANPTRLGRLDLPPTSPPGRRLKWNRR